jgi:hypothetical protein
MSEARQKYRINQLSINQINHILGMMSDRIDELEGRRGTPEFKSTADMDGLSVGGEAWPSFSVHKNGTNQTIEDSTFTKLTWDTKDFDTTTDFDILTNYRFTPSTAGRYFLTANATIIKTVKNSNHLTKELLVPPLKAQQFLLWL